MTYFDFTLGVIIGSLVGHIPNDYQMPQGGDSILWSLASSSRSARRNPSSARSSASRLVRPFFGVPFRPAFFLPPPYPFVYTGIDPAIYGTRRIFYPI